jgi:hypothetical protein
MAGGHARCEFHEPGKALVGGLKVAAVVGLVPLPIERGGSSPDGSSAESPNMAM